MTDQTHMTELDLLVGSIFTTRPEEDRELFEEERESICDLQDMLREYGVEVDLLSRPGIEIWESGIDRYKDLYQLRLLAASLEQGHDIAPILTLDTALESEPHPLLVSLWDRDQQTVFPHLIVQHPDQVYYLPIDFAYPIWLPEIEEEADSEELEDILFSVGSSIALQRELVELEQLLKAAHVSRNSPPYRCLLVLREGADLSVANDLPLILW